MRIVGWFFNFLNWFGGRPRNRDCSYPHPRCGGQACEHCEPEHGCKPTQKIY